MYTASAQLLASSGIVSGNRFAAAPAGLASSGDQQWQKFEVLKSNSTTNSNRIQRKMQKGNQRDATYCLPLEMLAIGGADWERGDNSL
jgi:hypothetical protein